MKKIIALCTVLALSSGVALAKGPGPHNGGFSNPNNPSVTQYNGGFSGPSIAQSTVAEALNLRDDQHVVLRGYIVQSLGGEDYLFKDETGTINIEVDHKRWRGLVVTPADLIEIQGEVDKDWNSIQIDVKRIFKIESKN